MMKRNFWMIAGIALFGIVAAGCIAIYAFSGWYGFDVASRRGGPVFVDMDREDARLSPSIRRVLKDPSTPVSAGVFEWRMLAPGFETVGVPVMAGEDEVDRIMLNRFDPKLYDLSVHNTTSNFKDIDSWEKALPKAALIVNGSYFGKRGEADTPFISEGAFIGRKPYDAQAGAFVADDKGARVVDLSHGQGWEASFKGAQNAMVSYPLLIGEDGQNHVSVKSNWLANRTFVAEDHQGRILIGTTKEAWFSIYRLGEFLRATPLDIKVALNLDGGPIACQSVRAGGFHRRFIAEWELQADDSGEHVKLLTWRWGKSGTWSMPVVLVATPKGDGH
jgi:hypothetical protein